MRSFVPVKPTTRPASGRRTRRPPGPVQARLGIDPEAESEDRVEQRSSLPTPVVSGPSSSSARPPRRPRLFSRDSNRDTVAQLQFQVVQALSRLSPVAHKLGLVLAESRADCEDVRRLGFAGQWTRRDLVGGHMPSVEQCQLIVALLTGDDVEPLADCIKVMADISKYPPCIAVIFRLGREPSGGHEQELADTRMLLNCGADDVIHILDGGELTTHRVMISLLRTTTLITKVVRDVREHPEHIKATRSLQKVSTKLFWELPVDFLEYIPREEQVVPEQFGKDPRIGMYKLLYELGAGSFGTVFKAQHMKNGIIRALKVMPKKQLQSIRQMASLNQELGMLLAMAPHPNVTRGYEALRSRGNIAIVMDFGGELNLHLFILQMSEDRHTDTLPLDMVESVCKQAAAAVAHLHSWSICHRDIKPKNFIIDGRGDRLVLVDFGFASLVRGPHHMLQSWCGSLPFVAPEVLHLRADQQNEKGNEGYSGLAADVWSLAIGMVEIGFGLYTVEKLLGWSAASPVRVEDQLQDIIMFPLLFATGPIIPVPCLARVLKEMLRLDCKERATMQKLVGPEGLDLSGGG